MDKLVKGNERVDDLHRKGLKIIQDPDNFCFGIDAVLLSDFAKAGKGERVADLGTGTGIVPILMTAKTEALSFTGIEIQACCADMAGRSVELNKLGGRVKIVCGDIRNCADTLPSSGFDVVTSNPPYISGGGGVINSRSPKALARHEIMCGIDELAETASRLLRFSGRFYMIHRPHRLVDIFAALRTHKLEPKKMRLVQPYADKEPNMVLIEAVRGGKPMLKILPPLVVYDRIGKYTDEVYNIYYADNAAHSTV